MIKQEPDNGQPTTGTVSLTIRAWRQARGEDRGHFEVYEVGNVPVDASFLEMLDILNFWMEKGVDGFRMDAVPFLFEDSEFRDEPRSFLTSDPEDYLYLVHIYTWNYPQVKTVLANFTDFVHEKTNGEGVVMLGMEMKIITLK